MSLESLSLPQKNPRLLDRVKLFFGLFLLTFLSPFFRFFQFSGQSFQSWVCPCFWHEFSTPNPCNSFLNHFFCHLFLISHFLSDFPNFHNVLYSAVLAELLKESLLLDYPVSHTFTTKSLGCCSVQFFLLVLLRVLSLPIFLVQQIIVDYFYSVQPLLTLHLARFLRIL